jgi:polysaccharide biosynthesis protein PslG
MKSRGRARCRFAIVVATLAVSLIAASAAPASVVRTEFYGVVQGPTLDDTDLQTMKALRVETARFLLNWGWVQPGVAQYKWGPADLFIGDLAAHGIRAVPSVWGNPSWLAGSSSTPPIGGTVAEQKWREFMKTLVARYGPNGTYWTTFYHQQYGAAAKPFPIQQWQIWNEPNLKKYFAPYPSPGKYARLLQISYPAIKNKDPHAQVILAGLPARGDITAPTFLKNLYSVSGIKAFFDAAALHPYMPTLDQVKTAIQQVRTAMTGHGDGATPLWISEIAWGSDPPDSMGINKGPFGQAQMLTKAYKMILANRRAWNIQRLFWYHLRDPLNPVASCSFCASAGLLRADRTHKPAFNAFKAFSAEKTAPQVTITGGPAQGSVTTDATPTFRFTSNEAGSTFQCRFDTKAFVQCLSPLTPKAPLTNRSHTFYVRAIDASGNVSAVASRTFTVNAN